MIGVVGRRVVGGLVVGGAALGLAAVFAPAASGSLASDGGSERFIVVLDGGDPDAVAAEHRRRHGAEVRHVYRHALRGYAAGMSEEAAARVARDERVAYVDRDTEVQTLHHRCGHAGPGDPEDACGDDAESDGGTSADTVPWGIARTGATEAHDAGHTGAGTDVYVIDTGIDSDHPDLEPNLGVGKAVVDCVGLSCQQAWDDDHGHGTHVAGTAGATDADTLVGMAPDATLHAVKVLNALGIGWTSDVIAGIDWVAGRAEDDPDAVVANMSLGGSGQRTATCTDTGFVGTDSYHEAVCTATHEGVVFSVAAGNSDEDAEDSVPAAYHDTVLTASATDRNDVFASFSNWGDDPFLWAAAVDGQPAPESAPVALAAPGVDVESAWVGGGTREASGTSMAAPHVGGAAALVATARDVAGQDRQTFLDVRAALMGEAEDTADFGDDSSYDGQRQEGFLDVRFLTH